MINKKALKVSLKKKNFIIKKKYIKQKDNFK